MLTLGLSGGLDPVHEQLLDTPGNYTYDGAAVLVDDGAVVAAVEEERLNRIKHSNKFPVGAIARCLARRGVTLDGVDRIAYYVDEESANALLTRLGLARPDLAPRMDARAFFAHRLGQAFGCRIAPTALYFCPHPLTHAMSSAAQSGFTESLVYVIDNAGGVFRARREPGGAIALAAVMITTPAMSIQRLFHAVFPFLGLGLFDEHKALALAAYGDAGACAAIVEPLYELRPGGDYALHLDRVSGLVGKVEPRRPGEEFSTMHKDLAAALQVAMERIVLHVLTHQRRATGIDRLCVAGGMAENSGTNGRVLEAGVFREVFVDPSAHDAGCALGAALLAADRGAGAPRDRVRSVAWGTDIGDTVEVASRLGRWSGFLTFERYADVAAEVARRVAGGAAAGWVQGRAEFGSHALGQRTALADPRGPEATERLGAALGRSTPYRPCALAVLDEEAERLFHLPGGPEPYRFMAVAARVREAARPLLAGGVHVDGTARVQTVDRAASPLYWALLRAFGDLTGVPALLTASLNTGAEPAADSVDDAVVTFLTGGLDALAVGTFVAARGPLRWHHQLALVVGLPAHVHVVRTRPGGPGRGEPRHELRTSCDPPRRRPISADLGDRLALLHPAMPVWEVLRPFGHDRQREVMTELMTLWGERLITLAPGAGMEEAA
jgi:carbamoyltransferase